MTGFRNQTSPHSVHVVRVRRGLIVAERVTGAAHRRQ